MRPKLVLRLLQGISAMSALKPQDRVRHIRLSKTGTCVFYNVLKKQWKVKWDNGKSTFCKVQSLERLELTDPKKYAGKKLRKMSARSKEAAPKLPTAANTKASGKLNTKIAEGDDTAQTKTALDVAEGLNTAKSKANSNQMTDELAARTAAENATDKVPTNNSVEKGTPDAVSKLAPNENAALFVKGAYFRGAGRFHDQRGFFQEMFNTGRDDFMNVKVKHGRVAARMLLVDRIYIYNIVCFLLYVDSKFQCRNQQEMFCEVRPDVCANNVEERNFLCLFLRSALFSTCKAVYLHYREGLRCRGTFVVLF